MRTALDGGRWAADPVEAVVFLDQITRALGLGVDDLIAAAAASHQAGIPQVRQVLPFVEPASASPWESRLRMFYIGRAGLPRPLVNMPIFDLDEQFLGIGDLFDPEAGLVAEFDGQDHRLRRQHRADNLREEKLEAANLVVCRVDSLDLRYPVPLAERLRERHAQGLGGTVVATAGPWSSPPGGSGGGHRDGVAACGGKSAAICAVSCQTGGWRVLGYSLVAKAESKDAVGGVMSFRVRMKFSASGPPDSRSIPASSHSIEMGPS